MPPNSTQQGNNSTLNQVNIQNGSVDNVLSVTAAGASGSDNRYTCSVTSDSPNSTVSCTAPTDWTVGEQVQFINAGPAALITAAPGAPAVTAHGVDDGVTYCYEFVVVDYWNGGSALSSSGCDTHGPSTADWNSLNYEKVVISGVNLSNCPYCNAGLYRQIGGSGPFVPMDVIPGTNGTMEDTNLPQLSASFVGFPATPSATTFNQNWFATVVSGSGTSWVVSGTAPTSTTNLLALHEDRAAFQTQGDAITALGGGQIFMPTGTYNLCQLSYYNPSLPGFVYTNPTTTPPSNRVAGVVHTNNNQWWNGASTNGVKLQCPTDLVQGEGTSLFGAANPTTTSIPGNLCNTGVVNSLTQYPIGNVIHGANAVFTTTPSDASNFNPGDFVYVGGGTKSGIIACSNGFSMSIPDEVTSVNAATGQVLLKYAIPSDIPYGTASTFVPAYIAVVNPYFHHDNRFSNFTFLGGAGYLEGAVMRLRFDHIKMLGNNFIPKLSMGGSRDIIMDDIEGDFTAGEQLDDTFDLNLKNSYLRGHGGNFQFVLFSEGGAGADVGNNHFSCDDTLTGFNNRAGGFICVAPIWGNSLNFHDNIVDGQAITQSTLFQQPNTGLTTFPAISDWHIHHNTFNAQSATTSVQAISEVAPQINQVIDENDFNINGASSASVAIFVLSGAIVDNQIRELNTATCSAGMIRVNNTAAQVEPLIMLGNTIANTSTHPDTCIGITSTQPLDIEIQHNTCIQSAASGNGIVASGVSGSGTLPVLFKNNMAGVTNPYVPSTMPDFDANCLVLGNPTGGCKGNGTINANSVFINGVNANPSTGSTVLDEVFTASSGTFTTHSGTTDLFVCVAPPAGSGGAATSGTPGAGFGGGGGGAGSLECGHILSPGATYSYFNAQPGAAGTCSASPSAAGNPTGTSAFGPISASNPTSGTTATASANGTHGTGSPVAGNQGAVNYYNNQPGANGADGAGDTQVYGGQVGGTLGGSPATVDVTGACHFAATQGQAGYIEVRSVGSF